MLQVKVISGFRTSRNREFLSEWGLMFPPGSLLNHNGAYRRLRGYRGPQQFWPERQNLCLRPRACRPEEGGEVEVRILPVMVITGLPKQ